jgi:hypothetical protein
MRKIALGLAASIIGGVISAQAETGILSWGRDLEDGRDFSFRVSAGQISGFHASLEETTRKLYDVTGSYWKQDDAENYNLDDFNIDDSYPSIGFSFEKAWRFFTFQIDASLIQIDSSSIAMRNYYISVGDSIDYNGEKYKNLKIPMGTPFDFDITGGAIGTKLFLSPFTFKPFNGFRITPLLGIGAYGFAGQYDIDAGNAKGVVQYQNPPEDFVIGGKASGTMGGGIPEYGGGAEIRIGTENNVNLVLQGHYMFSDYDGSTDFLTSSDHRSKNIDFEHSNIRGRVYLEFPLKNSRSITIGAEYQIIETTAYISSTATDPDEILEKQERFDKNVEFGLTSMRAMVGYTW